MLAIEEMNKKENTVLLAKAEHDQLYTNVHLPNTSYIIIIVNSELS